MSDYLIVHEDPATKQWQITQLVRDSDLVDLAAATPEQLADLGRQGWVGEGHYAAIAWDQRIEFDMAPGPVDVRVSAA